MTAWESGSDRVGLDSQQKVMVKDLPYLNLAKASFDNYAPL